MTNLRSIRMSDDIWEELQRLRTGNFFGKQKSWDELLNYFLICHHGNGDWRAKVKAVDDNPELRKDINNAIAEYLKDKEDFNPKEMDKIKFDIEANYYKNFVVDQEIELNHKPGLKKAKVKVKTHKVVKGGKVVGYKWYCGKCNSDIETNANCEPPCGCDGI